MQMAFLLALAAIAFAIVIALLRSLRHSSYSVKMAAIGIAVLFTFVIMRAASFHHLDQWVTVSLAGLRSGWWLEIAGIGTIAFAAIAYRMRWGINRAR